MLHFPARVAGGADGDSSSASPSARATTSFSRSALQVVEDDAGVFAFEGGGSAPITMTVASDGKAAFRQQGGDAARHIRLSRERPLRLRLRAFQQLIVQAAEVAGWPVKIQGEGVFDVRGVQLTPVHFDGRQVHAASANPDVSQLLRQSDDRTTILVNGSVADFIKACWVYDERAGVAAEAGLGRDYWLVIAKIELALKYLEYLNSGGRAFDDFVAHIELNSTGGMAWLQSLHDNLLGELNASMLRARLMHNAHDVPAEMALTRDGIYQLYVDLAGELVERPYCAGRGCDDAESDCAAAAFDFVRGWARGDYLWRNAHARLTSAAMNTQGRMWAGSGGSAEGFCVARHEGAGIELALKARNEQGDACEQEVQPGGTVIYRAQAGRARQSSVCGATGRWFVDFSVCARLRGVANVLDDFRFILAVRWRAPAGAPHVCHFALSRPGTLYHPALGEIDVGRSWLLLTESGGIALNEDGMLAGGFGDEVPESVDGVVSQNKVCMGYPFMQRLFTGTAESGPHDDSRQADANDLFGPGLFDIWLEAFTPSGVLLLENRIQVQVV